LEFPNLGVRLWSYTKALAKLELTEKDVVFGTLVLVSRLVLKTETASVLV